MQEARFGVTGFLEYDTEKYRLIEVAGFDHPSYYLEDIRTGAKYSPTVCLYQLNAEVGEDDILPLDTDGIRVVELTDAILHPEEN